MLYGIAIPFCKNNLNAIQIYDLYFIAGGILMKFLSNRKLATRISIITTAMIFAGMLLLWLTVSSRVASIVENNITNQMIDAVESRASIINDYVASAEEYMTAFALGSEVHNLLQSPDDPGRHWNHYTRRRLSERIPQYNPCAAAADKSGNHEIPGYRKHDNFHVLSNF